MATQTEPGDPAPGGRPVIDYIVEMPCEPRRRFGNEGLLARLSRLMCVGAHPAPAPGELEAAREEQFQLRPVAFHCRDCPANHSRRAFGCHATLQLPLAAAGEDWLVRLLPRDRDGRRAGPALREQWTYLRALLRRLDELEVAGEAVEAARRRALCERSRAASWTRGPWLRRVRVTSSQLLELLFFRGSLEPELGETVCRALGLWADGGIAEDGMAEAVFTQPVEPGDAASVVELKHFLLVVMVACSLDVAVRTRVEAGGPVKFGG